MIVLLPGMDGSGALFDEFAAALGMKTLVVSYPRDQALDYEQLEEFVAQVLPRDEPFILLGESFSGPIAIRVASRHLPNLRAVVLVCTFATLAKRRAPAFVHALIARIPFWRLPVSIGAARLFGRFNSAAAQRKLAAAIEGVTAPVWRSRMRAVLDVDVTEQLRRIQVPILYLRAANDRVVPGAASEIIASTTARAKLVLIEGPHALLQTMPEACAAAVREFARQAGVALKGLHE